MGHKDRQRARHNATQAGRDAYQEGRPLSDNPYKPLGPIPLGRVNRTGSWSLHPTWANGWMTAQAEHSNSVKLAALQILNQ